MRNGVEREVILIRYPCGAHCIVTDVHLYVGLLKSNVSYRNSVFDTANQLTFYELSKRDSGIDFVWQ